MNLEDAVATQSPAIRKALVSKWLRNRRQHYTDHEWDMVKETPGMIETITTVKKIIGATVIE